MAKTSHQHIYNIPAGQDFLTLLADMLLHDPTFNGAFAETFPLADFTILLPNHRAARELQTILLAQNDGKPLLMPRIRSLGDIDEEDEEELLFDIVDYADYMAQNADPKKVISPIRRETELLRLVMAWHKHMRHATSMAQCVALTADLVRFLDQAHDEEIDFTKLAALVPDQFSAYWQETIDFLKIITEQWPRFKRDNGLVDEVELRAQMLDLQNKVWREAPPLTPIIAAGTTGSKPVVARLLKCIAGLPLGMIILPGLDMDMASSSWAQLELEPAHPQAGFFHLLKTLEIEREHIRLWPKIDISPAQAARNRFVNLALLPAEETSDWVAVGKVTIDVAAAAQNLHFIEAPDTYSEAGVIALAMRETLETPKARAILVTKDRNLARCVAAQLRRWGIDINDTAGTPLARKPAGSFLRLILETVASDFAPVAFMALLKHPFSFLSMERLQLLSIMRDMERLVLRGVRPPASDEGGLASLVTQLKVKESAQGNVPQEIFPVLEKIEQAFAPLTKLGEMPPLCELAKALMEVAHSLSQKPDQQIAAWQRQDGEAAHHLLTTLTQIDENIMSVPRRDWLILFEHWLAQCSVRENRKQHPRLSIMGLWEARLMHADLLILGGLNEGSWPPVPDTGPWVSRPMCETLGMTLPERKQGLSAHDFVQAVCAPHVLMTRATKEGGTPTIAARWLTRMNALMKGLAGEGAELARDDRLLALWQTIDKVGQIKPASRPAPCPPIEARPTRLSVTQIQHLQSNPYAIYARYVLGLRPLDPLDTAIDSRLRGTFLHEVLEKFCRQWPEKLPDNVAGELQNIAQTIATKQAGAGAILQFWRPRFDALFEWLEKFEKERRGITQNAGANKNVTIYAEIKGALELDIAGKNFTLSVKADRIESYTDAENRKHISILDYKTGRPPTRADIRQHKAPQMPLEAAIAHAGGFEDIGAAQIEGLEHVYLHGGYPAGAVEPIENPHQIMNEVLQGVKELLATFFDPNTVYEPHIRPKLIEFANEYDHLARVDEWSSDIDEGEDK